MVITIYSFHSIHGSIVAHVLDLGGTMNHHMNMEHGGHGEHDHDHAGHGMDMAMSRFFTVSIKVAIHVRW